MIRKNPRDGIGTEMSNGRSCIGVIWSVFDFTLWFPGGQLHESDETPS